ncbi:hypothetical protein LM77097_420034 [Listeria monocytogenes]|nr:hypothetical protein LM77097_420034 [Listeria monocytogenes]
MQKNTLNISLAHLLYQLISMENKKYPKRFCSRLLLYSDVKKRDVKQQIVE